MSRNAWALALALVGCTMYGQPAQEPTHAHSSQPTSSSGDHYASDRRGGQAPTYAYTTTPDSYIYNDAAYGYSTPPSTPVMGTGSADDEVTADCTYNGIELWGDVKVVDSFPDLEVKVVDAFPDLNVKVVDSFPDSCGRWKFVDSFPDFTVKFVDSFPDIQIEYVESFPGLP